MSKFTTGFLLVLAVVLATGFQKIYSQACSVTNITVDLNSTTVSGGNCVVNFDLSWDQTNNGGNKFTNVHIWTNANYPSPPLTYGSHPTATELAGSLGSIIIVDPTLANPTLGISYPPFPTVTILPTASLTKTYVSGTGIGTVHRFTVKGITVTVPGACTSLIELVTDIWSSNSAGDDAVQCHDAGFRYFVNDPTVTGSIICNRPREFDVSITSHSTVKTATFTVYADLAPLGILDAGDPVIFTSLPVIVPALGTYTSGPIPNPTYPNDNLFVRVQVVGNLFSTTESLINTCLPLPVSIASFEGKRQSHTSVLLNWKTASEQNNKGFEVQRKNGSGAFQTIAFVPSLASDGNSSTPLQYQYVDNASTEEFTQYRLVQTDLDGRQKFSKVIIVKGNKSKTLSMLVYPNPTLDGNLTIVFNDASSKDVQLTDKSGRLLRTVKNVSASQYQLSNLKPGLYVLSVKHLASGESINQKIIVR